MNMHHTIGKMREIFRSTRIDPGRVNIRAAEIYVVLLGED